MRLKRAHHLVSGENGRVKCTKASVKREQDTGNNWRRITRPTFSLHDKYVCQNWEGAVKQISPPVELWDVMISAVSLHVIWNFDFLEKKTALRHWDHKLINPFFKHHWIKS